MVKRNKSATPPPPPTIREDLAKQVVKKTDHPSSSRDPRKVAEVAKGGERKRPREEEPTAAAVSEDPFGDAISMSRDQKSPSSSPSPPPVKTNRKDKKPFKIPKKKGAGAAKADKDDDATAGGFSVEGPAAEFAPDQNGGSTAVGPGKGGKKQLKRKGANNSKEQQQAESKKSKLAVDLFGDDEATGEGQTASPAPPPASADAIEEAEAMPVDADAFEGAQPEVPAPVQPSPNSVKSWAKFKEEKPDEYRIPDNVSEASSDIRFETLSPSCTLSTLEQSKD